MKSKRLNLTIGVPAYNEEKNIGALLDALLKQQTKLFSIEKIWVIASGCSDKTVVIAKKKQEESPKIEVIEELERTGKSAAINKYLEKTDGDIAIICSADVMPETDTIEKLCIPFQNRKIGMVGAHPIPINKRKNFMGYCIETLWEIHHAIALKTPKCGELIAFRNIIKKIPIDSPVDEASIEFEIEQKGLKIAYAPDAIIKNKGPETWREFFAQRRRINYGHRWIKKTYGHRVSTLNTVIIAKETLKKFSGNFRENIWLIGLICTELLSKILAIIDFWRNKKLYAIWERLDSTKNLNIH